MTLRYAINLMRVHVDKNQITPVIIRGKDIFLNESILEECAALAKYLMQAAMAIILHHPERYEKIKHHVSIQAFNIASSALINQWLSEIILVRSTLDQSKKAIVDDMFDMLKCSKTDSKLLLMNDVYLVDLAKLLKKSPQELAALSVEELAMLIDKMLGNQAQSGQNSCQNQTQGDGDDEDSDNDDQCSGSACNANQKQTKSDDALQRMFESLNTLIVPNTTMSTQDQRIQTILDNPAITTSKALDILNKIKTYGNSPLGQEEILRVDEMLRDIDWKKLLVKYMNDYGIGKKIYDVRRSWKYVNKRNPYLPGYKFEFKDLNNVYVALDTSGSMASELLAVIFSRLLYLDKMKKVKIYYFDVDYYGPYELKDMKDGIKIKGRGGTSPARLLNHLKEVMTDKDVLIFISDFEFNKNDLTYLHKKAIYIKTYNEYRYKISLDPYELFDE